MTVTRARQLRRTMNLPEVLLWRALRLRPEGLKFGRQHPAGPYILDFFCAEGRVAIEVDGETHNRGCQPDHDAARDAWLGWHDITVIRIAAADILRDPVAVAEAVALQIRAGLPLHHR